MQKRPVFIAAFSVYDKMEQRFPVNVMAELKNVLTEFNMPVIYSGYYRYRILTLISGVYMLLRYAHVYSTVILPLYGTTNSVWWYRILSATAGFLRKKVIAIVHGGTIPAQLSDRHKPFHSIFKKADAIVAPSAFMQHELRPYEYNVNVIENAIDINNYIFQNKERIRPRIFWMRTFHHYYDPLLAIEVASLLNKVYPDFEMVMAGADKGLLPVCKRQVKLLGLERKVIFPGYIGMAEKNQYAQEYDIFLCTNNTDNAPVSIIEAMAFGLPIVSTSVGGIPFIIKNGETGLLCEERTPVSIASALSSLIEYPAKAAWMAQQARKDALRFDKAFVASSWDSLIEHLHQK